MTNTLTELTYDEYLAKLRDEINEKGLYEAVKERCDEINSDASALLYIPHTSIQESLCEILDLIKESKK